MSETNASDKQDSQTDIENADPATTLEVEDGVVNLYEADSGKWFERRYETDENDFRTEVWQLRIHGSRLGRGSRFQPFEENQCRMEAYAESVLFGDEDAETVEYREDIGGGGMSGIVISAQDHSLTVQLQTGFNHELDQ